MIAREGQRSDVRLTLAVVDRRRDGRYASTRNAANRERKRVSSFRSVHEVIEWERANGGEAALRDALAAGRFVHDQRTTALVEERLRQHEERRDTERAEAARQAATAAAQELAVRLTDLARSVSRV